MSNNPNATKRQMDVSWDDWDGSSAAPEDPRSQPVGINPHHGGEHVTKSQLQAEGEKIIAGAHTGSGRQPTNEELFGHLVKPKEDLEKMESDWDNFFNNIHEEAQKPVDETVKKHLPPALQEEAWESGKSFNDIIGEEEARKRGKHVGR